MKTTRRMTTLAAAALTATVLGTVAPATGAVAAPGQDGATQHSKTAMGCPMEVNWDNAKTAFDFFVGKGLTKEQAAGVVGNYVTESGVNPDQEQCGGGPGRGLAQWEMGHQYARWDTVPEDNVLWFAGRGGADPMALQTQLDFTWYELETFGFYGLGDLRNAGNVHDATHVFMKQYERPGVEAFDKRLAAANDVFARFA